MATDLFGSMSALGNAIGQAWNGPPNVGPPNIGGALNQTALFNPSTIQGGSSRPKLIKKLTKFQSSCNALQQNFGEERHGISWYYEGVTVGDVIDKLGWWNPMQGGRPKLFAQKLLDGIPSPFPGKGFRWKSVGLVYFTPPIVGMSRSKNRTTAAGLALLKHWAECHQKFRPFFDAYYSEQAEQEITLECVDLALGVMPTSFRKISDRNVVAIRKKKERDIEAMRNLSNMQFQAATRQGSSANQIYTQAMQANMLGQSQGLQSQMMQANQQSMGSLGGLGLLKGLI